MLKIPVRNNKRSTERAKQASPEVLQNIAKIHFLFEKYPHDDFSQQS